MNIASNRKCGCTRKVHLKLNRSFVATLQFGTFDLPLGSRAALRETLSQKIWRKDLFAHTPKPVPVSVTPREERMKIKEALFRTDGQ